MAGVASRMVTAPIDLLKIRFQLETATKPEAKTYRTITHSIQQIYQQEGLTVHNTVGQLSSNFSRRSGREIRRGYGCMVHLVQCNFGHLVMQNSIRVSVLLVA